jgi:hypothetical protein
MEGGTEGLRDGWRIEGLKEGSKEGYLQKKGTLAVTVQCEISEDGKDVQPIV